jgi:putative DNA primase/helicase
MELPVYSEDAIALALVERYGPDLMHMPAPLRWYRYGADGWALDNKREIFSIARAICREFAAKAMADDPKVAKALATARTRAAVVNLASDDQRIVRTLDEFDADPNLLGIPGGRAVDLRTSELLGPDRKRLITMRTTVTPAGEGSDCLPWKQFLATTFPQEPGNPKSGPNQELIDYIQRWFGYSLTGLTSEERFAFLLGMGRNGKNTLIDTLFGIMGDYAGVLPAEALMERNHDPHRAELAVLLGKRLVISSEIPKGKRWNQARLMALSAGDVISANFMRENPFDFKFTGKLWIAGNHAPTFPSANAAAKERLQLIRFKMKFYHLAEHPELEEHPDPTIAERTDDLKKLLRAEWPAILRWGIDGAKIWNEQGLNAPRQVLDDSSDYAQDSDECLEWLTESCFKSEGNRLSEMFASWNLWRDARAQQRTTLPVFREMLKEKEIPLDRQKYGMRVLGWALTDFAREKVLRAKQTQETDRTQTNGVVNDQSTGW